jgi:predicted acetylornithine/succinylornithine family transaminase
MKIEELKTLTERFLFPNYKRLEIAFERGKGVYLWDLDGNKYIDFVAGIAVNSLGYGHPRIIKAVSEQVKKLLHVSNLYYIKEQAELAKLLSENSFGGKVFFCNSGAESIETALKLVRRFFWSKKEKRGRIVSMENSFHGRTIGALSLTGQKKYQEGFEPLLSDIVHIPFGDLDAAEEVINSSCAGVFVEPVQGEGGIIFPPEGYLKRLKEICERAGALLVFDEVQVGIGRLGEMFAYKRFGVEPDILTLAKGLGGGIPIGAVIAKKEIADVFGPGTHASTFGGNPLATSVGKVVIEELLSGVLENVRKCEEILRRNLQRFPKKYPELVLSVRGMGLMWGIELKIPTDEVVLKALKKGLIINAVQQRVLRITPPLIIKRGELLKGIKILEEVFKEL